MSAPAEKKELQEELGRRLGFAFSSSKLQRLRVIQLAYAAQDAHMREIEAGNSMPDDAVEFGLAFMDAAAADLASRSLLLP
jgi:hypothetical protein